MLSRPRIVALVALLVCFLPSNTRAETEPHPPRPTVLFENVRIFDGKNDSRSAPSNVLVSGITIEKISTDPIPIDGADNVTIIEGGGRTLMPGLIDAHWHAMLVRPNPAQALASDVGYLNLLAGSEAPP
jgi:imidazolonepropionase-like amidohydrolase